MSGTDVGANTDEARAAARIAERLNSALNGVSQRFETVAENLDTESLETRINGAFSDYYIAHKQAVRTVEENGTTLATNAEAAAERISGTDHEATGGFAPFPQSPLDTRAVSDLPKVLSPEALRSAGSQDYDTGHLLREVNRGER
ncbi:hypothetical protein [Nocardiopsis sp. MG754419]|uniref:hypothetical protein n=1 Tax=Nocardiopsis sp. MG754419 TaxID=2259865 RepID=UPI001BAA26BC|nr:hypothetical protein [Nocardiopsis sp. MG754419]MBR8743432.1 hypothetical protein [Nocardiopsis sp. MG754419]